LIALQHTYTYTPYTKQSAGRLPAEEKIEKGSVDTSVVLSGGRKGDGEVDDDEEEEEKV